MNFKNGMNVSAEKSPRVRKKLILTVTALAMAAVLVLCNVLAGLLPWRVRAFTFESNAAFDISSPTKTALAGLAEDVCIYLVTEDGDLNPDRDLYSFLKNYESLSSHITAKTVSTKADPDFLTSRGFEEPGEIAFLVESDRRCRLVPLSELYYYEVVNTEDDEAVIMELSPDEYAAYGASFLNSGCTVTPYFEAESGITNAVMFVTRETVPTVAVIESDGNYAVDATFLTKLSKMGYAVEKIAGAEDLTAAHDLLLYNTPLLDLTEPEAQTLSAWLSDGGDLFLTTYYRAGVPERLASILAEYGLSADEKNVRLVENHTKYSISSASGNYMVAKISSMHEATVSFDGVMIAADAHAIQIEEKQGISSTSWLYTTEKGSRERYDSSTGKTNPIEEEQTVYTYGVIAERGESNVVWLSTPYAFTRDFDILAEGGNYDLLASAFDWSAGFDSEEVNVEISPNILESTYLAVTWTAFVVWAIVLVALLPLILIGVGILRRYLRKKMY